VQPQLPPTHTDPLPLQISHAPPVDPQALESVAPETQVPPLQQPPLHTAPPAQLVPHLWSTHASPTGQSDASLHPQVPATQALPIMLFMQSTHAVPEPHALGLVPGVHAPEGPPQQLPVGHRPPLHLAAQVPPTHSGVTPLHATHAPPADPQLELEDVPATHSVPSQQPPLHFKPPAQLFPHSPVAGLHASFGPQLVVVQEPPST
jgi:hypothetical protein